jgi:predicted Zn-dependent peptidase
MGLEQLELLGASISGVLGYSSTMYGLDVPIANLKPALDIVANGIIEPLLLDEDIEIQKQLRINQIKQIIARPSSRSTLALRQALIQPQYRAARLRPGSIETISRITGDDVRGFFHKHYHPEAATIVMSGDFTSSPADDALDSFARWPRCSAPPPVHEKPQPLPQQALLIDRPGSVQADVRLGVFGIDNNHPEIANLWAACYVMGGAFLSRLNRVLREERGFTYGVQMGNSPMRSGGLLSASASLRNEVVVEGISMMSEIMDITDKPFTAEEIQAAINYASGSNPGHYQTALQLTDSICGLVGLGLKPEFVSNFNEALYRVTPEAASATYAKFVHDPTLIVIGDAKLLAKPLQDAGWPVEVITD